MKGAVNIYNEEPFKTVHTVTKALRLEICIIGKDEDNRPRTDTASYHQQLEKPDPLVNKIWS